MLFVLCKCIELRNIFCKIIIQFRKFFCFDLLNCAFEDCFFTCKFFCLIFFRECNFYVYIIANFSTNKLFLESRDKCVGTKCQRIICSFTALECLSVYEALEIDSCCVAILGCAILNCDRSVVLLLLFLKLCLNFLVCYFCLRLRNLKSFIVAKSYLWFGSYFCC